MVMRYRYTQTKDVDPKRVAELLALSREQHQYTNNGPVKILLEEHLQQRLELHGKCVVCFSSGTSALHALMFHCGDDVSWVIPAYTFPSPVVGIGAKVLIEDIAPPTFTLSPENPPECGGVILTNLFGAYVDMDFWVKFCKQKGLALIFDNAGSPLSKCRNTNICNFDAYSFGSLHHTKYLGFGEGGFAVVPSEEYKAVNALSSFGFGPERRHKPASSNFKMSDVAAAYILAHLESYSDEAHMAVQEAVVSALADVGVELLGNQPGTVYGSLPVVFDHPINLEDVDRSVIEVWKYYKPLADLPRSLDLFSRILNFPIYEGLGEHYIESLLGFVKRHLT